ncbi:DUF3168 domain-containing protein [Pseudovibrio ascidiaceicola]|uniref:DUF3168 domain-containing protein n=1 Tax=Pseudovibrio ascidiaceicola TaxID=285279 RepID=UPI003D35E854
MMANPDLELQQAVIAALEGDAALMEVVHGVYDSAKAASDGAPWGEQQGYVSLGPEDELEDHHDCFTIEEITVQIDCWSKKPGRVHTKQILRAVRNVLSGAELPLPSFGNVLTELELQRIVPDPEEGVTHGILQFTFEIQVY